MISARRTADPVHLTALALAVLCTATLFARPAFAVPVTLCGPTICYEFDNDPGVNAGISLFGSPSLLGGSDTLEFTPGAFTAASSGGMVTTSAVFQFSRVWSIGGAEIASITVAESGDYQILSSGSVNANLWLQVVDQVNDNGLPGFPEFVQQLSNWNTSAPTGFAFAPWSLSDTVAPAALFSDLASIVDLQIQNVLQAYVAPGSGGYAYIQKKLTLTTSVVPVPASVWLFAGALGLLGGLRRRDAC